MMLLFAVIQVMSLAFGKKDNITELKISIYRYYFESICDHFYTHLATELGLTSTDTYTYQGIGFYLVTNESIGSRPLYRYWKGGIEHFYTTSPDEIGTITKGSMGKMGFIMEGIIGYCYSDGMNNTVPLYRYFAGYPRSDHFYTTDASEIGTTTKGQTGNNGYVYEGIECYVYPFDTDSDNEDSSNYSMDYFWSIGLGLGAVSSLFVFFGLVFLVKHYREHSKHREIGALIIIKDVFAVIFIAVPLFMYFVANRVWLILLFGYLMGFMVLMCYIGGNAYCKHKNKNIVIFTWLDEIGLTVYYDILIDEGYETIDDILTITEQDLNKLNINKQMHIKRILKKINDRNSVSDNVQCNTLVTNKDDMNMNQVEGVPTSYDNKP